MWVLLCLQELCRGVGPAVFAGVCRGVGPAVFAGAM